MSLLTASIRKELRLLSRDLHALLVLFLMPIVFILVMSLALQEQFNGQATTVLNGDWQSTDENSKQAMVKQFKSILNKNDNFRISTNNIADNKSLFTINVKDNFVSSIKETFDGTSAVDIEFSPELGKRERLLILAALKQAYATVNVFYTADELGFDKNYARQQMLKEGAIRVITSNTNTSIDSNSHKTTASPNATQQNVPAWLIFAMFFISIPISTTMIKERSQLTLMRLQTLGLPPQVYYCCKLLPYFIINIIQMCLMVGVGIFLLPLLGGESFTINGSVFGFILMTCAVAIAAAGFSALIASLARTIDQATIISGTICILFGATGGVMVPSFVMPEFMRWVTLCSPMGWALQGFLDVVVRGKEWGSVLPEVLVLSSLGISLVLLSMLLFRRQ